MSLKSLTETWYRFGRRRWTRRNRVLLAGVAVLAVAGVLGCAWAQRIVRRGWPQTESTLSLTGLRAPVTVARDPNGVPHIYAEHEADLHFAQGYIHAQDRFWQMEVNRRRARGTLAQILGEKALASDERWSALDLIDSADRELAEMGAEMRASLDIYAAGVNAWLGTNEGRLPFEFTLLGWRGREVDNPAAWTAEDSLLVSLALSWQVGAPWVDPSLAEQIKAAVGPECGMFLLGEEASSATGSESGNTAWYPGELVGLAAGRLTHTLPGRWALSSQITIVSGDQTASGKPLIAVDLPSALDLPAPWYVMAWHIDEIGAAGASLPGLPDLVVGTHDNPLWETWVEIQHGTLSPDTPPWKGWLLAALFNRGRVLRLDQQAVHTIDELQTRLTDTFSPRAARLIPLLVSVDPQGWRQERVTGMLRKWDFRVGDNNKEAPFFAVYQTELARAAFADELGQDLFEAYIAHGDLYQVALDRILQDPDDAWWDDVTTPEQESRDEVLKRAYEPALEWIGRNYGDLHMLWEWDIVHGSRLHHALGDAWPWDQLLSQDLAPDGWSDPINASPGGLPCQGGICVGGDLFRAKAVYGYRQILDTGEPSRLWFTLLPGQSGHPFHDHYDDLTDEWLAGKYLPLDLAPSADQVESTAGVLVLKPED